MTNDPKASPAGGVAASEGAAALTEAEQRALEEKFDSEVRFRPLMRPVLIASSVALFVLSCFHYYTAGFGILQQTTHNGLHLAFTLGLVFAVFAFSGRVSTAPAEQGWLRPLGLPLLDWAFLIGGVVSAMYVPWIFDTLAMRVGNPTPVDVTMGTILILCLLEATRRAMGWPLPVIAILFMAYAYFGQSMPGILQHPGASWASLVNHLYLTSQGIYGTALGVIATYVFHFVLFGVLATRIGLGQLFIDLASALAGRYAGGPAKVSVLSSAMLGSISGSSIANTVTTGSLTIPAMIKIGYRRHFAAAVEAASSTGGQITPPVMGAVAFLMIEYLEVPLTTILTAALVPAFMHFFGVLVQVHMEAKRLGLRGLTKEELPDAWKVFKANWLTIFPLIVLVAILLSGRTPYSAAFWGISTCIAVMVVQNLMARGFVDALRATATDIFDGFVMGAKYSLSVTVAAALVGVVIGVVTLTGVGFKIVFLVTSTAGGWAETVAPYIPFGAMDVGTLTLLFTLMMTAGGLHPHGLRHPDDSELPDHDRHCGPDPRRARGGADRGAFLRVLLRRAGRRDATRGAGRLCRRRDRGGERVQGRQHGVPPLDGQGAGALRVRVLAFASVGDAGVHLALLHPRPVRRDARDHGVVGSVLRLPDATLARMGAVAPRGGRAPLRGAGPRHDADRGGALRAGPDPRIRRRIVLSGAGLKTQVPRWTERLA